MGDQIDISVVVITYNQKAVVGQTVESILRQRTSLNYEVLVADDASTDGAQEVLLSYQQKYPQRIKLLLRKKNVGPTRNAYSLLRRARGRYIASLEGGDYWSDEDFLERQAAFLDQHPEYIGVQDKCLVVDADDYPIAEKNTKTGTEFWIFDKREYMLSDFAKWQMPGHLSAMLYRNIYQSMGDFRVYYRMDSYVGDRTIVMLLAAQGTVYCTERVSLHYRLDESAGSGSWMAQNRHHNMRLHEYRLICRMERYVRQNVEKDFDMQPLLRSKIAAAVSVFLLNRTRENAKAVMGIVCYRKRPFRDGWTAVWAGIQKAYWIAAGQPEHRV